MLDLLFLAFQPLGAILASIASLIFELVVHLLATVLMSSWLSTRTHGLKRAAHVVGALAGLHLLSPILLAFFSIDQTLILSWFYSGPTVVASALVLLFASFIPPAVDLARQRQAASSHEPIPVNAEQGKDLPSALLATLTYLLALAIVLGGLSLWASQHERASLREKLCLAASEQLGPTWRERGETALKITEGVLNYDLRDDLPCPPVRP